MCYLASEIQLSYSPRLKPSQRPKITGSQSVYELLLHNWDAGKINFVEQFKVLLLDRSNKVLGIYVLSTGSSTASVVDCRLIFAAALKSNACGIILAHNHPSGNLKPSVSDKATTHKVVAAGKILEIPVMDHLIISSEGYFSFLDEGLL